MSSPDTLPKMLAPIDLFEALDRQHTELATLLADRSEEEWSRPSNCPGWTVSDVLLHLLQTDQLALASFTGDFESAIDSFTAGMESAANIDDGAGLAVDRDRGPSGSELLAAWALCASELRVAARTGDPSRRVRWVAGELTARSLVTTRLAESWIHTTDVCPVLGTVATADERLWHICRLAWRTIPYSFQRAGATMKGTVAFHLIGPAGEPWSFADNGDADTVVRGSAIDLCEVAGQRRDATDSDLRAEGADGDEVLQLVRTFA